MTGTKKSTRDAYGQTLVELGRQNKQVVVLDADLSSSTRTKFFAEEFPNRFFNLGIAEANLISVAAGLATTGKIPFASSFAVFATGKCFDQIKIAVAYSKTNVKIVATHGGISVGYDGVTHQAISDIAIIRSLPNITLFVPADAVETRKMLKHVVNVKGPCYLRLARPEVPCIHDDDYVFRKGQSNVLIDGNDVSLIGTGIMTFKAIKAANILSEEGIDARVINMSSIKPLDKKAIIHAAKETNGIVTAEDHSIIGGLGSATAEVVSKNHPCPVIPVGVKNTFAESGKPSNVLKKYGLTPDNIAHKARTLLSEEAGS